MFKVMFCGCDAMCVCTVVLCSSCVLVGVWGGQVVKW